VPIEKGARPIKDRPSTNGALRNTLRGVYRTHEIIEWVIFRPIKALVRNAGVKGANAHVLRESRPTVIGWSRHSSYRLIDRGQLKGASLIKAKGQSRGREGFAHG
jgi:hypothetical protein